MGKAIAHYICAKWEEMLLEVEEAISETDAPLSGDKLLIETIIHRKHLFGYLRRQMSIIYQWATRTSSTHDSYPSLRKLKECEDKLKDWTEELDQVSNSLLGMLSISESTRAGFQAVRTKNITILAFIFIPISTVASIYGMNVTEFSGEAANPEMKSFGISAAVVLVGTALVAWIYIYLFSPNQNKFGLWIIYALDGFLFCFSTGLVILSKIVLFTAALAAMCALLILVGAWALLLSMFGLVFSALRLSDLSGSVFSGAFLPLVGIFAICPLPFVAIWTYDSTKPFRALKTKDWLWPWFGYGREWGIDGKAPRKTQVAVLAACVVM